MAVRRNTAARTSLAQAFADTFPASSTLEIRSGSQPASANDAASGSLLATITLPASPWAAAASGAVSKQNTWSATATGTDTAGWARLISADTNKRYDFAIGSDLTIDDASIVTGGTVTVTTLTITQPTGE